MKSFKEDIAIALRTPLKKKKRKGQMRCEEMKLKKKCPRDHKVFAKFHQDCTLCFDVQKCIGNAAMSHVKTDFHNKLSN